MKRSETRGHGMRNRDVMTGVFSCILAVALCGCVSPPGPRVDAGPLFTADRDVHGNPGVRVLGPLVERRVAEDGKSFTAVRPFWSRVADPAEDRTVSDVVWPLGMVKTRKGEQDWRLFPAFGHDFDSAAEPSRHRWSVFPVLFGGRTKEGLRYFAVFPLGGTLHEFLGRDRIGFALFPLYAFSTIKDQRTHSVLWPVYSRTKGTGVYRFRVWPFYGISVNEDRWTKRFVLWPFWTSVRYDYPDQKGAGFVLFPLYGRVDVEDRHSRMLLPPFFKYEWAGANHRALNAPWPLIQYSRGNVDKLYLWPFYGRKSVETEQQWFALWPFVSGRRNELPAATVRRFQALPLVFYESRHALLPVAGDSADRVERDEADARYFKLWPLVSYRRENDVAQFRALALWPLKQTPGIERNWAPLWSLFSRDRAGEVRQTELLWGLYRHRRSGTDRQLSVFPLLQATSSRRIPSRSWTLLYGLAGYEQDGLHREIRLLYFFRFGRRTPVRAVAVEQDILPGGDTIKDAGAL